jgi:hypothetical protein
MRGAAPSPASGPRHASPAAEVARWEKLFVLAACLVAGLRVFVFNAAWPFFNNNDERAHFDLIYKYSTGWRPQFDSRTGFNDNYSPQSAFDIFYFGSLEFYFPPAAYAGGRTPPPVWQWPRDQAAAYVRQEVHALTAQANHEALAPPLYYLVAGAWRDLGVALGRRGLALLYWIKWLNVFVYMALVALAWRFCRMAFPDGNYLRLAVPLALVTLPQSLYYSITNDVPSPLVFLAALTMLGELSFAEKSWRYHAGAGLLAAAAFLVKESNIAILAAAAVVGARGAWRATCAKTWRRDGPRLAALGLGAALPVAAWLAYNRVVFGVWLIAEEKARMLTWLPRPASQWLHHPIFTLVGLWSFFGFLLETFWRGEMKWHRAFVSFAPADWFFIISSIVFAAAALVGLIGARRTENPRAVYTMKLLWLAIAVSVAALVFKSISVDFNQSWYPSRAFPYLASGRLVAGLLVPFLTIYVYGLEKLLSPFRRYIHPLWVVALIAAGMFASEVIANREVFASQYNWWHMPR